MDAILTDSHLDIINRIKTCILMNVIVPKSKNMQEKHGKGTRSS